MEKYETIKNQEVLKMNYFKNFKVILSGIIVFAMSAVILTGCGSTGASTGSNTNAASQSSSGAVATQPQSNTTAGTGSDSTAAVSSNATTLKPTKGDADGDGIPDTVEKTYGTNPLSADTDGDGEMDKTDKDPCLTPDLINETSTTPLTVTVKDARVEDNVNASDHLEITLTNTGNADLKDFDIYYSVTDSVTKKMEGYYLKLTGFTLEAGATKTLHFDNKQGDLHYTGNFNGIYGTSKNEVLFQGQIHVAGFAPLDFTTKKSKGTAEVVD